MPVVSINAVSKREDEPTLRHRNSCTDKPLEDSSRRRDGDVAQTTSQQQGGTDKKEGTYGWTLDCGWVIRPLTKQRSGPFEEDDPFL